MQIDGIHDNQQDDPCLEGEITSAAFNLILLSKTFPNSIHNHDIYNNLIFTDFVGEHRRPSLATMRSPIPIEPMHSFSYGHHSSVVNGSPARTYDDVPQHSAHTGQLMHCIRLCNLILVVHFMVN